MNKIKGFDWKFIYAELVAGLIMVCFVTSIWFDARTGNWFWIVMSNFWAIIIFWIMWYAFYKRLENKDVK